MICGMDETTFAILKLFILIFSKLLYVVSQDLKYGLCSDPQCSQPVAIGRTIHKYHSDDRSKLSFDINIDVLIFVKEYGEKKELFGIELNKKRGYVPKTFVKETQSLRKNLVPANFEFTRLQLNSYHITSHVPESSHLPPVDLYHSVQPSVPNSFNFQSIHQSGLPLESSRQGEHSHSHASSDLYHVNNEKYNNYYHGKESIAQQAPQMDISSHSNMGSESTLSSSYSKVHSHQSEFHLPNPSSPYFEQRFGDGMLGDGRGQNFDSNSNNFFSNSRQVQPRTTTHAFENSNGQPFNHMSNPHSEVPQAYFTETATQVPSGSEHYPGGTSFHNQMQGHPQAFTQLPGGSKKQNLDHKSNNLFHGHESHIHSPQVLKDGQNFNFPSNSFTHNQESLTLSPEVVMQRSGVVQNGNDQHDILFHNQISQTPFPQIVTQSQDYLKIPNFSPMNREDSNQEFDKTMAMLKSQGLLYEGDVRNQFSSEKIDASSFKSSHFEHHIRGTNKVHGGDFSMESGHTNSLSDSRSNIQSDNMFYDHDRNRNIEKESEFISSSHTEYTKPIISSTFSSDSSYSAKARTGPSVDEVLDVTVEEDDDEEEDDKEEPKEELYSHFPESNVKPEDSKEDINSMLKPDIEKSHTSKIAETTSSDSASSSLSYDFVSDDKISPKEIFNEITVPKEKTTVEYSVEENSDEAFTPEKDEINASTSNRIDEKQSPPSNVFDHISFDKSSLSDSDSSLLNNTKFIQESGIDTISKNSDITSQENEVNYLENNSIDSNKENNVPQNAIKKISNKENNVPQNASEPDFFLSTDPSSDLQNLLNVSDISETESELLNAYQTRHLKDVENINENLLPIEETDQTISYTDLNFFTSLFTSLENGFEAIRSFIEALLPWIPDPLYTIIIDLEKEGISPKVPVFTVLSSVPCIILMVLLVYIKEKSKEKKLIAQLTDLEKNLYNLIAEKNILEEKLEKIEVELQISRTMLEEEKMFSFKSKTEIESLKQQLEETSLELEKNVDIVDTFKEREKEYTELVRDHEKEHMNLLEQKTEVENRLVNEEATVLNLSEQLQEKEMEIQKLVSETSEYCQANEVYQEKLALLQKNCNQLLQEAEVWNMRVKELNEKLNEELSTKKELENSVKEKDSEIKALTEAVQIFKSFEEVCGGSEEECNTNEEKVKHLINSSNILIELQNKVEENNLLSERLLEEKNKLLEMEVSILDAKSEIDKLKLNYNQALQDKAEAQTKLDVLTNYFKDKEILLQKQLGVQEAVRQKTEDNANSAERRICLIEQENSSYKFQVATMKQEIEETERNLKSQIAVQEKKAHENWLAARTAERKLEDVKQEVMQLRQRLTLLEREQETWLNSTREEIIRPVPKRITHDKDDTIISQDPNSSIELRPNMFPPPPMMLPPDRPLPPLPPLPFLPPFELPPLSFLPPFEPPPFRPQPWHMPPPESLSNSDYRITPPEFIRGRESTPPRERNTAIIEGDMTPRQSSPLNDMRNSTPPHLLPDFHDIPPYPPHRHYFPPMGPRARFPLHPPPFRRELVQGQRRQDNQDENNSSSGSLQSSVPQENWHNPNSRV